MTLAAKTLAPAPSFAQREKLSVVGLGGASTLISGGAGASVAVSCNGTTMSRSSNLAGDL
jgi:hypothetical protein